MSDETLEAGDVVDAPTTESAPTDAPAAEAPAEATPEAPALEWADIRTALSGGDEAMDKVIGRYRSLDAFGKAFMAQRQKLSERAPELPTLGENPSDEEVAAYREAYGIPAEVDGYEVTFGEEFDHSEADQGILDGFKAAMHESNVPPGAAQAAINWYQNLVETDRQAKNEMADTVGDESANALKAEWGREFDGNVAAVQNYLNQSLGEEQAEDLRSLRMEDGSFLMDNADVLRLLVQPAIDYVGPNSIIGGDVATAAKTLNERKDELLSMRLNDPNKFKSEGIQEELADIYGKLSRLNG
jgi:hypothetical protein